MNTQISEIQIIPIKPNEGLVAFASCVLYQSIYLGSIGIITKPEGGYRLSYPTKKVGDRNINIYHPIEKQLAESIETSILRRFFEVTNTSNENLTYERFKKY